MLMYCHNINVFKFSPLKYNSLRQLGKCVLEISMVIEVPLCAMLCMCDYLILTEVP